MRQCFVGEVPFECPQYVVRVNRGWQLRLPRKKSVFVGDAKHFGPAGSHAETVRRRAAALPIDPLREGIRGRALPAVESKSKKRPLGTPGIFLVDYPAREGRAAAVYLVVSRKGAKSKLIYVGTPNTYKANLPQRLIRARQIREEWMLSLHAMDPNAEQGAAR
jgi:hypothetical protein